MFHQRFKASADIGVLLSLVLLLSPLAEARAEKPDQDEGAWVDALPYVELVPQSVLPSAITYLRATADPVVWDLEKRGLDKAVSVEGSFHVERSLPLTGNTDDEMTRALRERGIDQLDRSLVIGTRYAKDGSKKYVAGLRIDLRMADASGEPADSALLPALESNDLEQLGILANKIAEVLETRSISSALGPLGTLGVKQGLSSSPSGKSTCMNHCQQDRRDGILWCVAQTSVCVGSVSAFAVSCALSCPATGPAAVACILACGFGDFLGVVACLFAHRQCERAVDREFSFCERNCRFG